MEYSPKPDKVVNNGNLRKLLSIIPKHKKLSKFIRDEDEILIGRDKTYPSRIALMFASHNIPNNIGIVFDRQVWSDMDMIVIDFADLLSPILGRDIREDTGVFLNNINNPTKETHKENNGT